MAGWTKLRDFDETNITQTLLEHLGGTPDLKLKRVMQSLVRHLHDFARDVEPSFKEWSTAIDYLTRTGHMCTDKRQEDQPRPHKPLVQNSFSESIVEVGLKWMRGHASAYAELP
jgi:Catechol dioxygenase N terminus